MIRVVKDLRDCGLGRIGTGLWACSSSHASKIAKFVLPSTSQDGNYGSVFARGEDMMIDTNCFKILTSRLRKKWHFVLSQCLEYN